MFSSFNGSKKVIAVMGATGQQGGATLKAFNNQEGLLDQYELRAITRDPTADKAKAIESLVSEVVKADGDDEESMVEAFKDCYGAFIISDFWQDMDPDHEARTLLTCAKAAKKAGVKHIILSMVEDTRPVINAADNKDTWKVLREEGGMYVPHFDGKGDVIAVYEELPTTLLHVSFYYENFINFGMGPSRQADTDPYGITFPMGDAPMDMVAVEDIGKSICAIFQDDSLIGKTLGVASETMPIADVAAIFTEICGQPVQYNDVPTDVYASFGFPGAVDLANMFRFYNEFSDVANANRKLVDSVKERMGGTVTLKDWITTNKDAFVLEPTAEVEEKEVEKSSPSGGGGNLCCVIS